MATIRASCPECGDVELSEAEVSILVCRTTDTTIYSFECAFCSDIVTKPAAPRVVDQLVSTGVRLSVWEVPAEMEEPHIGPPIDYNDLLDFHEELEGIESRNDLNNRLERAAWGPQA